MTKPDHRADYQKDAQYLNELEEIGPYSDVEDNPIGRTADMITELVKGYFEEVRLLKQIPLVDIRRTIVPSIHQMVETPPLFELLIALQAKDHYIYRHAVAVGVISTLIGKWMELSEAELLQLTTAAVLHDVGKMQIPHDILNKPEKLTAEEYEVMKKHTVFGYELIKKTFGTTHRQALVALQHHERMDGKGYPLGIMPEQIDLFSRIVAVADAYHAMASKRLYQDPSPFYEVLTRLKDHAYGAFDPAIVHVLIDKIMQSFQGCEVRLTDGRRAKIVLINHQNPIDPLVQSDDGFIDLSKEPSVHIEKILF